MNKIVLLVSVIFLTSNLANAEKIKLGISVPLTGKASSYGTDIKNALIFANESYANSNYELIIEDDQCSDREAVNIAHKFVKIDHVKYVLGFGCSGTVLAAAPVYENAQVVVIASGTGAPNITNAGDYVFRTKPTLNIASQKLYSDAASKFKTVGIITEETAYCQGLTDAFMTAGKSGLLNIVNENFLPQNNDFRGILTKFKAKKIDALFINTQGEADLIMIFKLAKSLNLNVQFYGNFHPGSQAFLNAVGKVADGMIYTDTPFAKDLLNKEGLEVFSKFEQKFGPTKSSEHFVILSYLAFVTLDQAIKSGENVKDYLYKTKFNGTSGEYSFDKNGDILSEKITYVLKQIKDGKSENY